MKANWKFLNTKRKALRKQLTDRPETLGICSREKTDNTPFN